MNTDMKCVDLCIKADHDAHKTETRMLLVKNMKDPLAFVN